MCTSSWPPSAAIFVPLGHQGLGRLQDERCLHEKGRLQLVRCHPVSWLAGVAVMRGRREAGLWTRWWRWSSRCYFWCRRRHACPECVQGQQVLDEEILDRSGVVLAEVTLGQHPYLGKHAEAPKHPSPPDSRARVLCLLHSQGASLRCARFLSACRCFASDCGERGADAETLCAMVARPAEALSLPPTHTAVASVYSWYMNK